MREMQQDSYVLHARAYRETSCLVDIFTRNHGRVSAVANGARRTKSKFELVPFVRGEASWTGKAQLKTLTACDGLQYHQLTGKAMLSAVYLNEILMLLLQPFDPHPQLFDGYRLTLEHLGENGNSELSALEVHLREFEKLLLREIGYEVQFDTDMADGSRIQPHVLYRYSSNQGFIRLTEDADAVDGGKEVSESEKFRGELLLNIASTNYCDTATLQAAKKIMRAALHVHTGGKQLHSRSLFVSNEFGGSRH